MKKLGIGLLVLSISLAMTGIGFDNAFAEEIKIENGRGSSEPGCEVTNYVLYLQLQLQTLVIK